MTTSTTLQVLEKQVLKDVKSRFDRGIDAIRSRRRLDEGGLRDDSESLSFSQDTRTKGDSSDPYNLIKDIWRPTVAREKFQTMFGFRMRQTILEHQSYNLSLSYSIIKRMNLDNRVVITPPKTITMSDKVYEAVGYADSLPFNGKGPVFHNTAHYSVFTNRKTPARVNVKTVMFPVHKTFSYLEWGDKSSLEGRDIDEQKILKIEARKTQYSLTYLRVIKEEVSRGDNHIALLFNWMCAIYDLKTLSGRKIDNIYNMNESIRCVFSTSFPENNTEFDSRLSYEGKLMRYLPDLRGNKGDIPDLINDYTVKKHKEPITFPEPMSQSMFVHMNYVLSGMGLKIKQQGEKLFHDDVMTVFGARMMDLAGDLILIMHRNDDAAARSSDLKSQNDFTLNWMTLTRMLETYVAYYGLEQQLYEAKLLILESLVSADPILLPVSYHAVDWMIRMNSPAGPVSGRVACMPSEDTEFLVYMTSTIGKKFGVYINDGMLGKLEEDGWTLADPESTVKLISYFTNTGYFRDIQRMLVKVLIGDHSCMYRSCKAPSMLDVLNLTAVAATRDIRYNTYLSAIGMLKFKPRVSNIRAVVHSDTMRELSNRNLNDGEYAVIDCMLTKGYKPHESQIIESRHWADPEMEINLVEAMKYVGSTRQRGEARLILIGERNLSKWSGELRMVQVCTEGETEVEKLNNKILLDSSLNIGQQVLGLSAERTRKKPSIGSFMDKMKARRDAAVRKQNAEFVKTRQEGLDKVVKPPSDKLTNDYNHDDRNTNTNLPIDGKEIVTLALSQEAGTSSKEEQAKPTFDEAGEPETSKKVAIPKEAISTPKAKRAAGEVASTSNKQGHQPPKPTMNGAKEPNLLAQYAEYDPPGDGRCGWYALQYLFGEDVYDRTVKLVPTLGNRWTSAEDMLLAARLNKKRIITYDHPDQDGYSCMRFDPDNNYPFAGYMYAYGGHWYASKDKPLGLNLRLYDDVKMKGKLAVMKSSTNGGPTQPPERTRQTRIHLPTQADRTKVSKCGPNDPPGGGSQDPIAYCRQMGVQSQVGPKSSGCPVGASRLRFPAHKAQGIVDFLCAALCMFDDTSRKRPSLGSVGWFTKGPSEIACAILLEMGYQTVWMGFDPIGNRALPPTKYVWHSVPNNVGPMLYINWTFTTLDILIFDADITAYQFPEFMLSADQCGKRNNLTDKRVCCYLPNGILVPDANGPLACKDKVKVCPAGSFYDLKKRKCVLNKDKTKAWLTGLGFWIPVGFVVMLTAGLSYYCIRRGRLTVAEQAGEDYAPGAFERGLRLLRNMPGMFYGVLEEDAPAPNVEAEAEAVGENFANFVIADEQDIAAYSRDWELHDIELDHDEL